MLGRVARLFVTLALVALSAGCRRDDGVLPLIHAATPTASASPTASQAPSRTASPTTSPTPTPTPGPTSTLAPNPPSLTFSTLGTQQTFEADETGYTGTITASSGGATNCSGIAVFGPSSASGPSATFTVTSIADGSCQIMLTDSYGQTAVVSIVVDYVSPI